MTKRTKSTTSTTPKHTNTKTQDQPTRRTNFNLVTVGLCPHDQAKLSDEIQGKGVGLSRTCSSCKHIWYLNTKIRTCKCITCSMERRNNPHSRNAHSHIDTLTRIDNQEYNKDLKQCPSSAMVAQPTCNR